MLVGPPKMAPMVWKWLSPKVYGHVLAMVQERLKDIGALTDPQIVELRMMEREAKKYAKRAQLLRGTVRQVFELDLTGWRYMAEFERRSDQTGIDPWDEIDDLGTDLLVQVSFKDVAGESGYWDFIGDGDTIGKLVIDAFAPLYKTFRQIRGDVLGAATLMKGGFNFLYDTVRHELEHMGQDLMEAMTASGTAGDVARRHRGPLEKVEEVDPMDLHEAEFYPRLKDDARIFSRHLRSVPKTQWRAELERWSKDPETYLGTLYHHDRTRWRKGVAEFGKELHRLGVRF